MYLLRETISKVKKFFWRIKEGNYPSRIKIIDLGLARELGGSEKVIRDPEIKLYF